MSRNKMREIGCKSKKDVLGKLYGGSYGTSPTDAVATFL